jgi:hypothetical protein
MKKLFVLLLLAFSTVSYSQIMKTGGILYSNGNPNTKGLDTLTNDSNINDNILTTSGIEGNTLTNSTFDFSTSGTLSSKTIQYNYVQNSNITVDISATTTIFGNYPKNIFKRADGTIRLSYYNNSDVLTVVDVNN